MVKRLNANADENPLVVGDLNNTPDMEPIKAMDRTVWRGLNFTGRKMSSRLDYQLASKGMARELDRSGTRVQVMPDWGAASDYRPVVARFFANDH